MIKKILAILKKDFLIESSYKLSFFFSLFGVIVSILSYYFIDKMFGSKITDHLKEFGVNYFSYVLLSMGFFSYIGVGIGSFSERIRQEQLQGTLESLLLSPTKPITILIGLGIWNLFIATFDLAVYIILGIFVFKIDFSSINLISTILVLFLTVIAFGSLGILSASFVIVLKKGNPVGWIINNLQGLIGGVYFPVSVMPGFLQILAKFLPITYAIRSIELAVYKGYGINELSSEILILFLFSLCLMPISFFSFKFALNKAKKDASLTQY